MTLVALTSPRPHIPTSELERAVTERRPLQDRLHAAQVDLARCAATLGWMAENPGPDSLKQGRAISRHMRGIRKLIEIELRERKTFGRPDVDLRSQAVEQVVELLLGKFADVLQDVLPEEKAKNVMMTTRARVEGWQDHV